MNRGRSVFSQLLLRYCVAYQVIHNSFGVALPLNLIRHLRNQAWVHHVPTTTSSPLVTKHLSASRPLITPLWNKQRPRRKPIPEEEQGDPRNAAVINRTDRRAVDNDVWVNKRAMFEWAMTDRQPFPVANPCRACSNRRSVIWQPSMVLGCGGASWLVFGDVAGPILRQSRRGGVVGFFSWNFWGKSSTQTCIRQGTVWNVCFKTTLARQTYSYDSITCEDRTRNSTRTIR